MCWLGEGVGTCMMYVCVGGGGHMYVCVCVGRGWCVCVCMGISVVRYVMRVCVYIDGEYVGVRVSGVRASLYSYCLLFRKKTN